MTALDPGLLAAWPARPGAPVLVADAVLDAVRHGHIHPHDTTQPAPELATGPLTPRQHQVLTLLMRGRTKAQIGVELGIAEDTVRNLVRKAYERLGAHNRVEAAIALGMLGGQR